MISGFAVNQVYLATGFTDMRKSINGLSLIVSEQLAHDPFSGSVFVFCNRARDKLKILYWECNGFCCIIAVWIRENSSGQRMNQQSVSLSVRGIAVVTGGAVMPTSAGAQTCLWLAKQLILASFLSKLSPYYCQ